MTVNVEKLLRMAEQISANMRYTQDSEVVATNVASHLNRFWDERMRSALKVYASESGNSVSSELQAVISKLD